MQQVLHIEKLSRKQNLERVNTSPLETRFKDDALLTESFESPWKNTLEAADTFTALINDRFQEINEVDSPYRTEQKHL